MSRTRYRKLTQGELRAIAMKSVREMVRASGIDPLTCSADFMLAQLDILLHRDGPYSASTGWYAYASGYQIDLFKREWAAWRKSTRAARGRTGTSLDGFCPFCATSCASLTDDIVRDGQQLTKRVTCPQCEAKLTIVLGDAFDLADEVAEMLTEKEEG